MDNLNQDFLYSMYGSKLYGTSTPASDTDEKVIYLPALTGLLLGKKPKIFKTRVDATGKPLPDDVKMPDGGRETEYIPLQQFVHDFIHGQTYALEVAHAYESGGEAGALVRDMIRRFGNSDVYSMTGFAMKQTFDYVRRGERLNEALRVIKVLDDAAWLVRHHSRRTRLDTPLNDKNILDYIVAETGLKTSTSTNNNKTMRTLELNGRSYLETTTVEHIRTLLHTLVGSYGDRTKEAAEEQVDFKSLSHAVRVYQQAIELLETGKITFPRPNAEFLLSIKQGRSNLDETKQLLRDLDDEVRLKIETSTVRKRTPELEAAAEDWLVERLGELYKPAGFNR